MLKIFFKNLGCILVVGIGVTAGTVLLISAITWLIFIPGHFFDGLLALLGLAVLLSYALTVYEWNQIK